MENLQMLREALVQSGLSPAMVAEMSKSQLEMACMKRNIQIQSGLNNDANWGQIGDSFSFSKDVKPTSSPEVITPSSEVKPSSSTEDVTPPSAVEPISPPVPKNIPKRASRVPSSIPSEKIAQYVVGDENNKYKILNVPDGTRVVYDGAGRPERYYNADGKETRLIAYEVGGNGVNMIIDTEYNANGKERFISYNSDGSVNFFSESKYDTAGHETRHVVYNSDGSLRHFTDNEYDTAGNKTRETLYNSDGSLKDCQDYKYDADGNCTWRINYNSDGIKDSVYSFEYDANGKLMRETEYNL